MRKSKKGAFNKGTEVVLGLILLLLIMGLVIYIVWSRINKGNTEGFEKLQPCVAGNTCNCYDYITNTAYTGDACGPVNTGGFGTGTDVGTGPSGQDNVDASKFKISTKTETIEEQAENLVTIGDYKPVGQFYGTYPIISTPYQQYSTWVVFFKKNEPNSVAADTETVRVFISGNSWGESTWCWKTFNIVNNVPSNPTEGPICGGNTGNYLSVSLTNFKKGTAFYNVDVNLKEDIAAFEVFKKAGFK